MEPILIYYGVGLTLALGVGAVSYLVVGHAATPLLRAVFGQQAGPMWGRLFRISVVTVALVGALTTKFYGCGGPTDYQALAKDHQAMLAQTSEQVSGSLSSSAQYLLLAAMIGAIAFAAHEVRRTR